MYVCVCVRARVRACVCAPASEKRRVPDGRVSYLFFLAKQVSVVWCVWTKFDIGLLEALSACLETDLVCHFFPRLVIGCRSVCVAWNLHVQVALGCVGLA